MKNAFDLAVKYLSYCSRSEREVRNYLKKKEFPPKEIQEAIEKLHHYGYQDDRDFGKNFILLKGEGGKKGRRFLFNKLKEKGLEEKLIEELLEKEYPIEKEEGVALKEAYRFARGKKELPMNRLLQRLYQRLASRGFSSEVVGKVIETLRNDQELQQKVEEEEDRHYTLALKEGRKIMERRKKKNESGYVTFQHIYGSLMRKGYTRETIDKVKKQLESEK